MDHIGKFIQWFLNNGPSFNDSGSAAVAQTASLLNYRMVETKLVGESPGLVVMKGDSCLQVVSLSSNQTRWIVFHTYIFVLKTVLMFEKTENKLKRSGMVHF